MSNRNPDSSERTLLGMTRFAIRQSVKDLNFAAPGLVRGYDASKRRAKIQPALDVMLTDGSCVEQPVIADVPVLMPSGGGFVAHFPLAAGDAVMLLFSQRGMDAFKLAYGRSCPDREVICDMKDAVAIPGFGSLSPSLPASAADSLMLSTEDGGSYVSIGRSGITLSTSGAVSINSSGLTHNGTNVGDSHTHGGVLPGGASTGGPS